MATESVKLEEECVGSDDEQEEQIIAGEVGLNPEAKKKKKKKNKKKSKRLFKQFISNFN
jgi:hypothetical protein